MADMFGVRYVIIYVILPDFYKIFIDFYHMYSSVLFVNSLIFWKHHNFVKLLIFVTAKE